MKVAFWSNARGKSCVTSNLACISVLSALSRPNERTIVFENHQNIINLGSTFFCQNSKNVVKEQESYIYNTGLGRILQSVERGEVIRENSFYHFTRDLLGKRLFYVPAGSIENSDFLEYRLEQECIQTLACMEQYSDLLMIDTSSASLVSSRKILQEADLVVVNLNQNRQMLSHLFRNYSSIREKAFYLIGNYEENSELTKAVIMKKYQIPGSQIGTIPHNMQFSDAVSNGQLIPFLLHNYACHAGEVNYGFIAAAKESVELLRRQMEKCGKEKVASCRSMA